MKNGFIIDFKMTAEGRVYVLELGAHIKSAFTGWERQSQAHSVDNFLVPPSGYGLRVCDEWDNVDAKLYVNAESVPLAGGLFLLDDLGGEERFLQAMEVVAHQKEGPVVSVHIESDGFDSNEAFSNRLSRHHQSKSAGVVVNALPTLLSKACKNKGELHRLSSVSPEHFPPTMEGRLSRIDVHSTNDFLFGQRQYSHFVLKPLKESCSRGVTVLPNEKVVSYLEEISRGEGKDEYWRRHRESDFLLQGCISGKWVEVNGRQYEPTGRVFVTYDSSRAGSPYDFAFGYWKLPASPVLRGAINNATYVSEASRGYAAMNQEDFGRVRDSLSTLLFRMFSHFHREEARLGLMMEDRHPCSIEDAARAVWDYSMNMKAGDMRPVLLLVPCLLMRFPESLLKQLASTDVTMDEESEGWFMEYVEKTKTVDEFGRWLSTASQRFFAEDSVSSTSPACGL